MHTFGTNETQQLFERQLVGGMLLQTLATAASGQRQAMLNATIGQWSTSRMRGSRPTWSRPFFDSGSVDSWVSYFSRVSFLICL